MGQQCHCGGGRVLGLVGVTRGGFRPFGAGRIMQIAEMRSMVIAFGPKGRDALCRVRAEDTHLRGACRSPWERSTRRPGPTEKRLFWSMEPSKCRAMRCVPGGMEFLDGLYLVHYSCHMENWKQSVLEEM